jgi:hypothetical protein
MILFQKDPFSEGSFFRRILFQEDPFSEGSFFRKILFNKEEDPFSKRRIRCHKENPLSKGTFLKTS